MNILSVRDGIKKQITKFFDVEYGLLIENISITIPEMEFGDLSTNICLAESKSLKVSPIEIANKLVSFLRKQNLNYLKDLEVKGPGFINFWLSQKVLVEKKSLFSFLSSSKNNFVPSKYTGKSVLVEHSSPNLFKPFTIGHLMNNFTGEFLVRAMKETGAFVTTISFPSDISMGIAKAVYVIKEDGGLVQDIFETGTQAEIVEYLGKTYVRGVELYKKWEEENNQDKIRDVKEVANNMFQDVSGEDLDIFEHTKKINLDYLFSTLNTLGSSFDGFIFESEAGVVGKELTLKYLDNIFERSEGAIVYVPNQNRKDINTSVFINSEGNPTYEAKDLGLLKLKFERYNPDHSFFITDNEQGPHFRVVLDAGGKIDKIWEEKSIFVPHGRMSFRGERMSSRLGGVPNAFDVLRELEEEIVKRGDRKIEGLSGEEKEKLNKNLALSGIRITILKSKLGINIDFDPEKSLSMEGDSGPYLCYTHARIFSLLEKGRSKGYKPRLDITMEIDPVLRKVFQYELMLEEVINEIAPQKLITYLFELASLYNSFYANTRILEDENKDASHQLYISQIVKEKLQKSLDILGIKAPEKM